MLTFDVGGTFIKYAIIEDGQIIHKDKVATPDGSLIQYFLSDLTNALKKDFNFSYVGISSAGQIDVDNGEVIFASSTIPNYTGARLKESIFNNTGLPCTVLNDVEACLYNYTQTKDLLYIALGTGIGGAYKVNGKTLRGENGIALEVGHTWHVSGDTFENICSTNALMKRYAKASGNEITGEELDELISSGDSVALNVINEYFDDLVLGIINIKYILDCNNVKIGGGITEAKFFTKERILKSLDNIKANTDLSNLNIDITKLGNDAAILGVYNYVKENDELN